MSLPERFAYWKMAAFLKAKAWAKHLPNAKKGLKSIVIVAGLPRSGTTLLHTYLNSHLQVFSFGHHEPKEVAYIEEQCRANFAPFVRYALFKVLLSREEPEFLPNMVEELLSKGFKVKLVVIERENLLRNFVSLKIAERNQLWSAWRKAEVLGAEKKKISLSPKEALAYQEECKQLYAYLDKHLASHTITYEQLVEEKEQTLQALQAYLTLKQRTLKSLLKKQNPEPLEELVENWSKFEDLGLTDGF